MLEQTPQTRREENIYAPPKTDVEQSPSDSGEKAGGFSLRESLIVLDPLVAVLPPRCIYTNQSDELEGRTLEVKSEGGKTHKTLQLVFLAAIGCGSFIVRTSPDGTVLVAVCGIVALGSGIASLFTKQRARATLEFWVHRPTYRRRRITSLVGLAILCFGVFGLSFGAFAVVTLPTALFGLLLLSQQPAGRSGKLIDGKPTFYGASSKFRRSLTEQTERHL